MTINDIELYNKDELGLILDSISSSYSNKLEKIPSPA